MDIPFRNSARRYGWIARIMHWTTVALVAAVFIDISGLDVPPKNLNREAIVALHISLGLAVLGLMLLRFGWRVTNPNPVYAYGLSPVHRIAAITVHRALYVIVIALCACGIVAVIGGEASLSLFGLALPAPDPASFADWRAPALAWHDRLSVVLLVFVAVHATAAVVNQVFAADPSDED